MEVRPGIELFDQTSVTKLVQNGFGVILQSIKFLRQAGGIAVPDSVAIHILPDEMEGSLPVEQFLRLIAPPCGGRGCLLLPVRAYTSSRYVSVAAIASEIPVPHSAPVRSKAEISPAELDHALHD